MPIPFPVFFPLNGEKVLIVGTNGEAVGKLRLLARTAARVTIVGAAPQAEMIQAAQESGAILLDREFLSEDLDDARLCFVALETEAAAARIVAEARARKVTVNAVDRPALCDFTVPAIIDRAPVLIAISTGGAAPALARDLRRRVETVIPAAYGRLATICRRWRERVASGLPDITTRRRLWDDVLAEADLLIAGTDAEAEASIGRKLAAAIDDLGNPVQGRILFVGAGPGDPELMTLKGLQAIQKADVIFYDDTIDTRLFDLARRGARLVKLPEGIAPLEIADLVATQIAQGAHIVRLKAGNPQLDDTEFNALISNGIQADRIPGITL